LAEERLRKVRAEADRVELEVAQTRGELLPAALFEDAIGKEHDRTRAIVVSIPGKHARLIAEATGASIGTAQSALADLTDAILAELQGSDDDDPETA
jgi:phage terminase Nu1 subunit (DNA packaging protein)